MSKVAVVTGASHGLGAATVAAYRKLGWSVVANSRNIEPSDDPDLLTIVGDVSDPAVGVRVIEEGLRRFGRVDTLVNNAGVYIAKPFTDYTLEDFDAVTAINLRAFVVVTQKAVEAMLRQGGGHVVSITTSLTDHANSLVPAAFTSLTKGGLNSATKGLAIEYATRGIRFNAVSPGVISTPMHAGDDYEFLAALHPMKRLGEASDIAEAIIYLESATFVTGEILHVDGGQSAGQ